MKMIKQMIGKADEQAPSKENQQDCNYQNDYYGDRQCKPCQDSK